MLKVIGRQILTWHFLFAWAEGLKTTGFQEQIYLQAVAQMKLQNFLGVGTLENFLIKAAWEDQT